LERPPRKLRQRLLGRGRRRDRVPLALKQNRQHVTDALLIIHDEDLAGRLLSDVPVGLAGLLVRLAMRRVGQRAIVLQMYWLPRGYHPVKNRPVGDRPERRAASRLDNKN